MEKKAVSKLSPSWLDRATQAWADTGVPGQEGGEPAAGQIQREVEWGAVCGLVFR